MISRVPTARPAGSAPPLDPPHKHMVWVPGGTFLMGSDGFCSGKPSFQGFALTLSAKDEAHADRLFNALADGGQVQMSLGKTFFSPRFGMVTDRFGVMWMVLTEPKAA